MSADAPLVEVHGLTKRFALKGRRLFEPPAVVHAVEDVSFAIRRGETFGLVGESGCGKTTTGRMLVRLLEPTEGRIVFDGEEVGGRPESALRGFRRRIQMIFQDPFGSLNPRMTAGDIVAEPLEVAGGLSRRERPSRVAEALRLVGLAPGHAERYPHEFSGGQRQRIGIARAIVLRPDFIVCDEAVSALDVSTQAQIVNLLQDLQAELGLTYVFISHDLGVVRQLCDRVGVMYLGKIAEIAGNDTLFTRPLHPYTRALLSAVPVPEPGRARRRIVLEGDVPSPVAPPSGCLFHTRCPYAEAVCRKREPALREVEPGHAVACHFVEPAAEGRPARLAPASQQEEVIG